MQNDETSTSNDGAACIVCNRCMCRIRVGGVMPGYSDILLGYREGDPYRQETYTKYAGRCVSCGNRVHVTPSGFDILRRDDCDARLLCMQCDGKYPDEWTRAMG